jgi:hypothetical protein
MKTNGTLYDDMNTNGKMLERFTTTKIGFTPTPKKHLPLTYDNWKLPLNKKRLNVFGEVRVELKDFTI